MRPGILVVAKSPVAGEAKTRLGADIGYQAAADLAGAALLDTLDAAEAAFPRGRRVIAATGDLGLAERSTELARRLTGWDVIRQRGEGFGRRLENAHDDAARLLRAPILQIGMDTPHVSAHDLLTIAQLLDTRSYDAVLGPAADGGWWSLGLAHPRWARGLNAIPMSTSSTGRDTRTMLVSSGARVVDTDVLTDVDNVADAESVARAAPESRFAQAWRCVVSGTSSPAELFDEALAGAHCVLHGMPNGPMELPVDVWQGACDSGDQLLVAECEGPTLDVGCGPGRLTEALALRTGVALGIDVAHGAVRQTRARGAQAMHRDVFDPLPAEGRWASVLLADGNIGIGGDPVRMLRRVEALLSADGRAVVEVAPPGSGTVTHRVHLEVAGRRSSTFEWAVVGAECLDALARQVSLRMLWAVENNGRWFAKLGRAGDLGCAA